MDVLRGVLKKQQVNVGQTPARLPASAPSPAAAPKAAGPGPVAAAGAAPAPVRPASAKIVHTADGVAMVEVCCACGAKIMLRCETENPAP